MLSTYKKCCNKWFVTSDRTLWNKVGTQINLKKFRAEVRIIEEEVLACYQNVTISSPGPYQCNYESKKMSIVIDRSQIDFEIL